MKKYNFFITVCTILIPPIILASITLLGDNSRDISERLTMSLTIFLVSIIGSFAPKTIIVHLLAIGTDISINKFTKDSKVDFYASKIVCTILYCSLFLIFPSIPSQF